jgi:hypothetical protein
MSACTRPLIFIGKKKRFCVCVFFQLVPNCEFDQKTNRERKIWIIFSQVNVVFYQQLMIKRQKI